VLRSSAAAPEPLEELSAKSAAKAAKRAARRLKILEEVLNSERMYVKQLRTVNKVYIEPLRMVADMPAGKGQIFSHADLDNIFLNIDLLIKVNEGFLSELEAELNAREMDFARVEFGAIIKNAAKHMKGCYTRYVTNYDTAEGHLQRLSKHDQEKSRYLAVCKTHPDAGGLDVRSFLIQPVQRVPRYRMLLEDLLAHTDPEHVDEAPLRDALQRVCEVAKHINEEKRHLDEVEKMRALVARFANAPTLEKELVSYERRLLKEGQLSKMRMSRKQERVVMLCNDVMLYSVKPSPGQRAGLQLKGKIWLRDGAKIKKMPHTEATPHAFAVVAGDGKGYTWLAESAAEAAEWVAAITAAIDHCQGKGRTAGRRSLADTEALSALTASKTLGARLDVVHGGSVLTKYNNRDGKSSQRWVVVKEHRLFWGDAVKKKAESSVELHDAISIQHGAQSPAFFKNKDFRKDLDWQCFSVVSKERTIDFAADRPDVLMDWYLALASLIPQSKEPLLDESALRTRIEGMMAG